MAIRQWKQELVYTSSAQGTIKLGLATCKASTFTSILSLRPNEIRLQAIGLHLKPGVNISNVKC